MAGRLAGERSRGDGGRRADMHGLTLFLFAGTLAVMPAPLASNRDWAWSPLAAVAGLLLLGAAASLALRPGAARQFRANMGALLVPGLLAVLGLGWAAVQISGWTPAGWATPISAESVLGPGAARNSVAFDREAALTGLMRLLTNGAFFFLGAILGAEARDARRILGTIVVAASLYTLYAMVAQVANEQAAWTGLRLWVPNEIAFSSTFVNRNNYATYAGVSAIVALCLALRPGQSREGESARQRWRRRLAALAGARAFWLATALVLIVGVLLSASKAGGVSFALAALAMVFIYSSGRRRAVALLATFVVFFVALLTLPGASQLARRLLTLAALGEESREALYALTIQQIELRPLLGWGLNSFSSLYSMLQPSNLREYYDKAHDTYLELALDLGIPAASALILAVSWVVFRCLRGFYERRRDPELAGVGFLAAILVGFHAFFDFSLQIPAMACTFFAILGIAWAQSWSGQTGAPMADMGTRDGRPDGTRGGQV